MEVILKEDVRSLGHAGEIIRVRDGFARNFLLPQKKAVVANAQNQKMTEQDRKNLAQRLVNEKEEAKVLAEKIGTLTCTLTKQSGEEDKLFGSVTSMEIAQALAKEGLALDKRLIHLEEPIKKIGSYTVTLKLHPEVNASLKVKVVKQ